MLNNYVAVKTDRMIEASYSIVKGTYFERLQRVFKGFLLLNLIN